MEGNSSSQEQSHFLYPLFLTPGSQKLTISDMSPLRNCSSLIPPFLLSIALFLVVIFAKPPLVFPAPPINWEPETVSGIVAPGGSESVTVAFNAFENLGNIVAWVVPEIAPFVRVEPSSFANVRTGQTIELSVIFQAAPNAPLGMFDGTVQLRSATTKGKGKVFARPLPVTVTVRADSLIGTDANNDGVWDYIGDYITQTYQSSNTTSAALRQMAVALQAAIVQSDDPVASVDNATALQRSVECLYSIRPEDAYNITNDLTAVVLNTPERSRAYIHFSDQLGGQTFPSTPLSELGTACTF